MAYNGKTDWQNNEIVEAADMNRIEQGISDVDVGLGNVQAALDGKVDDSQVLTNVPTGAVFTDTVTTINGKTGAIVKADITALGIPAQDTVYTHPATHSADIITDGTTNKTYTATEKTKLAGIAAGAEVNVKADWNAVSGDAQILNKPTLATEKIRDLSDATIAASSQLNIDVSDFDWAKYSSVIVQCDSYGQGATVNFGVRVNNHATDYAMCRLHVANPTVAVDTNNLLGAYGYIYKSSTPPQPLFIEIWNLRFLNNDGDPMYRILSSIRDSEPSITLGRHYSNGDLTTINICNFSTVASVILGNMSLWGVLR